MCSQNPTFPHPHRQVEEQEDEGIREHVPGLNALNPTVAALGLHKIHESVFDIQRKKVLIRDRKGVDLMPATFGIFFPNPNPPAFPNIVLSKTDKRLQHFGTRTNTKVDLDRSNRMTQEWNQERKAPEQVPP